MPCQCLRSIAELMKMIRTYRELIRIPTFNERLQYLKLKGIVGAKTFGSDRYLNQGFYQSHEWKRVRNEVIVRDMGCDLAVEGMDIYGKILIHHMNPLSPDDIIHGTDYLLNPDYLICTSKATHDAIHYGDESILFSAPISRTPGDTCPWK